MPLIAGPITVGGSGYAAVDDSLVSGGLRVVADAAERDAIPDSRRKAGMEVFTASDGKAWRLSGSVGAWSWSEITIDAASVSAAIAAFTAPQQAAAQVGMFGALTGQSAKVLRVKSDESGFEYATPAGAEEALSKVEQVGTYDYLSRGASGEPGSGSYVNEASTFTGWGASYNGATIGYFDRVRVTTRWWDATHPTTTLYVQVRANDRTGTLLASGSGTWTAAEDTTATLEITLDNPVNESGNIFVGHWGNGRHGYISRVSPTSVPDAGTSVTGTCCSTTSTGATPTWSAPLTDRNFGSYEFLDSRGYTIEGIYSRFDTLLRASARIEVVSSKWRGLVLPSTIYALEGRELNVFFRNAHDSDFLESELQWEVNSSVGTHLAQFERCLRYTPDAADAGTRTLTFIAYHRGVQLQSKTVNLVTKALSVGSGITRRVISVGDSTASHPISELVNLFNYNKNSPTAAGGADVMSIDHSTVGKSAASENDAEGNSRSFKHDGNSGFTTANYASGTTQFGTAMNDVAGWLASYGTGLTSGDWVVLHLGLNGSATAAVDTANIKIVVDALAAGLPVGMKFCLLPTYGPGAFQDGFVTSAGVGTSLLAHRARLMALRTELLAQFEGYTNTYICPAYLNLDTENNYPTGSVNRNARNTASPLTLQTDYVHPAAAGYYQVADCIKSVIKGQET